MKAASTPISPFRAQSGLSARILLVIMFISIGVTLAATDISGAWNGVLDVMGYKLRIVFNISAAGDSLSATMDSPDQEAYGIPVQMVKYYGDELELLLPDMGIAYMGKLEGDRISGTFSQGGQSFAMDLSRDALAKPVYDRPQEPREPYPYSSLDVTFSNPAAGIELAGTLTIPSSAGKHPGVVLVSGSGPQDRNEELLAHKPFLVLADHLTRNGIAVLRYDDRGVGLSGGEFSTATTYDLASDASAAVDYLLSRGEFTSVGVMGHSEGGIIAPLVASSNPEVDFIVLLAGTGIRGDKLILLQSELLQRAGNVPQYQIDATNAINARVFDMIVAAPDTTGLRDAVGAVLDHATKTGFVPVTKGTSTHDTVLALADNITSPWMFTFLRLDPAVALSKTTCPVLAVNGEKDLQVPHDVNLPAIAAALEKAGNRNFLSFSYPNLNHLFQECETGSPDEYGSITQTFAPHVLEDVTAWILRTTGN